MVKRWSPVRLADVGDAGAVNAAVEASGPVPRYPKEFSGRHAQRLGEGRLEKYPLRGGVPRHSTSSSAIGATS